ncbi:hypothetical protein AOLI_G00179710 [Acnodon oligacanthus]
MCISEGCSQGITTRGGSAFLRVLLLLAEASVTVATEERRSDSVTTRFGQCLSVGAVTALQSKLLQAPLTHTCRIYHISEFFHE